MKKLLRSIWCVMFFLAVGSTILAQELIWEKDFKEDLFKVNWLEQREDGMILAAGDLALAGVDCKTGEIIWKNESLKSVSRTSYRPVTGLPIFTVIYSPKFGKLASAIINSETGEIIFDTGEEEASAGNYHFLYDASSILFEFKQKGRNVLLLFNYEDNEVKWRLDMGDAGMFKSSFMAFDPTVMSGSRLMITEKERISVVDYSKGEIVWTQEFDKKIRAAVYSSVNDIIYVGEKNKLKTFQGVDGKDVTSGKQKLDGELLMIFPNSDGMLVFVDTEGFNVIDPASGEFVWKKAFSIRGMYDVMEIDDAYYAFGREEGASTAAKVGKDGKKIWKEKISGFAYYMIPIEVGIFYLSTEKSNIITYDDGKSIWKKDVKFKTIPTVDFDEAQNDVVLYSKKNLYRFDLDNGEVEQISKDLKLDEEKDPIFDMKARKSGYFIFTAQYITLVDRSGNVVYTKYFEPVETANWLGVASQVASMATGYDIDIEGSMATLSKLDGLTKGGSIMGRDQGGTSAITTTTSLLSVNDKSYLDLVKQRFENSQHSKDNMYILTESAKKVNEIIMVDKDNGKIVKNINLQDESPSYIVDEVNQFVIVNENNRKLTCYKMD